MKMNILYCSIAVRYVVPTVRPPACIKGNYEQIHQMFSLKNHLDPAGIQFDADPDWKHSHQKTDNS